MSTPWSTWAHWAQAGAPNFSTPSWRGVNLATAAADKLALGRDVAVDPAALARVISRGSGTSFALGRVASAGGTRDRIAAHAGHVRAKDVRPRWPVRRRAPWRRQPRRHSR